ncbi:hypothetical protein [Saccharibacillus alkalitolerans]|uniref:Uncharacterized protein n=1 Tax=Saccharibacillus alkalitolerans TaxID=2705290 RepID=A0ABX0F7V7_9BACL|nr:hypothetical protein [Saccharibacillus alkalitolerans]NGZ77047.1 hypothetical protein [Saccharibacillus alkalitolerans]
MKKRQANGMKRVMKLRDAASAHGIGFEFYPARGGDPVPGFQSVFLYETDAEFVISRIRSRYPLVDPENGESVEAFDPCWDNPVPAKIWEEIVRELEALRPVDPAEAAFVREFARWAREALEAGEYVTIVGNL